MDSRPTFNVSPEEFRGNYMLREKKASQRLAESIAKTLARNEKNKYNILL